MSTKKEKIEALENRNAELSKEILLNEVAIYEAEKELNHLDEDIIEHEKIQAYIQQMTFLIDRLNAQNRLYKVEIFENNYEIKKLKEND